MARKTTKSSKTDFTDPIFTSAEAAREHLENLRWPDGPFCPHCGELEQITKLQGKTHRAGLYKCRSCRSPFTVTVGTVFERSKIPLHKWILAFHLMSASKKGVSAHQIHRMLGITYKSAWFMAHRIRESMKPTNPEPMGGKGKVVEADETFTGPKMYTLTPEGWQTKRGLGHKYKIVSLVERKGRVRSIEL